MDQHTLSRIDRAVADNIKDIQRSFGTQAGLVQDFIVFISHRLKTDLFGYTRFTLQDFCKQTGRNRQDLALLCADFVSGKFAAPVIEGFAFQTVFDYGLYSMMERNIIFSSRYEVREKDSVLVMHSFSILKDLRLNFVRGIKEQKVYEVRLSDELLQGFLSRYYTVNTESYKLVGKGRGGDSRKKLLLYLSKLSHVVQTSGHLETVVPLDRLCEFADITDVRPAHKKQNLVRVLNHLIVVGKFGFKYVFTSRNGYMVTLAFEPTLSRRLLQNEHNFYHRLLSGLRSVFDTQKVQSSGSFDKDPFQAWLVDSFADVEVKAQILAKAYYAGLGIEISFAHAISLIRSGTLFK
ncbi:hypothetical protein HQN86_12535 [Pedobacter panaciterrae]|uniref:hypothetical protein n=1 Tax=Pedobacter panaciterrae TaxID=363849 RepID=UPI00155D8D1B|nr:hypothetical protein [Pedobacter panaciterrae]NQX54444.1 hypothetical protein [Pedobacter panaciterrae]